MGVLPGDVNDDGFVDIFDVNLVSSHWGETGPVGDANGDMTVDIFDVNLISANWSPAGAGATVGVPEPTTGAMLALGLLCIVAARFRIKSGPRARSTRLTGTAVR
jgi:hypothetical protein